MTSAYSKICGYKKFSVHTNTKKFRFRIVPLWKTFSKVPFSCIFLCGYKRISVDGRRIHNNKVAFSNLSGIVWTGPKQDIFFFLVETWCLIFSLSSRIFFSCFPGAAGFSFSKSSNTLLKIQVVSLPLEKTFINPRSLEGGRGQIDPPRFFWL